MAMCKEISSEAMMATLSVLGCSESCGGRLGKGHNSFECSDVP